MERFRLLGQFSCPGAFSGKSHASARQQRLLALIENFQLPPGRSQPRDAGSEVLILTLKGSLKRGEAGEIMRQGGRLALQCRNRGREEESGPQRLQAILRGGEEGWRRVAFELHQSCEEGGKLVLPGIEFLAQAAPFRGKLFDALAGSDYHRLARLDLRGGFDQLARDVVPLAGESLRLLPQSLFARLG